MQLEFLSPRTNIKCFERFTPNVSISLNWLQGIIGGMCETREKQKWLMIRRVNNFNREYNRWSDFWHAPVFTPSKQQWLGLIELIWYNNNNNRIPAGCTHEWKEAAPRSPSSEVSTDQKLVITKSIDTALYTSIIATTDTGFWMNERLPWVSWMNKMINSQVIWMWCLVYMGTKWVNGEIPEVQRYY